MPRGGEDEANGLGSKSGKLLKRVGPEKANRITSRSRGKAGLEPSHWSDLQKGIVHCCG
jgi:hypothetical protein